MILRLLERLAENSSALFDERELNEVEGFSDLSESDLLVPADRWRKSIVRDGRLLTVFPAPRGGLEALDETDTDYDPVPIEQADIAVWQLDLTVLLTRVAERNGLDPEVAQLSDRVWQVALCAPRTPVLFGLLPDGEAALAIIRTIPSLLPKRTKSSILITPSILSASWNTEIERLGIEVASLTEDLQTRPAIGTMITASGLAALDVLLHEPSGLTLSPDLDWAQLGSRRWDLPAVQGRVVHVMFQALLAGTPELHQDTILQRAGSHTRDLATLFHRTDVIGTLIVRRSPGVFALSVTPTAR